MHGVLLVHKPPKLTSHDVVAMVRKRFHTRKVGHAGTLDPFATGLLLLCLGDATKIVRYLSDCEKEYRAVMKLGEETDTQDPTGQVVRQIPVPMLTDADILRAFDRFRGEIEQIPPMYSARRVQGKRLYELARQGKTVERKAHRIQIAALEILDHSRPFIEFRVVCSKGTYVRTLAHDIGKAFGCGAHLTELQRTRIGTFHLADAFSLDQLSDRECRLHALLPLDEAMSFFPAVTVHDDEVMRLLHGGSVEQLAPFESFSESPLESAPKMVRVYDSKGAFLALAQSTLIQQESGISQHFQPVRVFARDTAKRP